MIYEIVKCETSRYLFFLVRRRRKWLPIWSYLMTREDYTVWRAFAREFATYDDAEWALEQARGHAELAAAKAGAQRVKPRTVGRWES